MPKLIYLLPAVLLISSPGLGFADTFNAMTNTTTYSKNRQIKVFSKTDEITYAVKRKKLLWTIGRYVKFGYVSNDGKYFVAVYGGGNLVPIDASDELILLTFYRNGELIKEIKFNEIIDDRSQLVATASHLYWGNPIGFVKPNKFQVKRIDGKTFSFDLSSY